MDPVMVLLLEAMLEKSHSPEEFQAYVRAIRTPAESGGTQGAAHTQTGGGAEQKVQQEKKETQPSAAESLAGTAAVAGLGMMLGLPPGASATLSSVTGAGDIATKLIHEGATFVEDLIGFDIPMIGG